MPARIDETECDALPPAAVCRVPQSRRSHGKTTLAAVFACAVAACHGGRPAPDGERATESAGIAASAVPALSANSAALATAVTPTQLSATPPATIECPPGMVAIPGASFWVGTPAPHGPEDEHPRFRVRVADFCMEKTEVTVASYTACVQAGKCADAQRDNFTCNGGRSERPNHPINCVSWREADRYCAAQGARLPTEVEWEYAARGGTEYRAFSFGEGAADGKVCWKSASSCPVSSFATGAFGLSDMTGNVWEWTSTRYGTYPWGDETNPNRVYRGGSWSRRFEKWLSPTLRNRFDERKSGSHLGFRCAAFPQEAQAIAAAHDLSALQVEDVECPSETKWNGMRCARSDSPVCPPGSQAVTGHGCRRARDPSLTGKTELSVAQVVFDRSPEFDADCREFQKQRTLSFKLTGGSHDERTLAGKLRGCKNRDVGVGWNSTCCP